MSSLIRGDALRIPLRDNSVDLIVTSPPYFALRSYQDGGAHYAGQIGSEATPQAFIDALIAVTQECKRVLKPSGSMFVNLGDSYAGSGGYNNSAIGAGGRGPASYKKAKWGNSQDGQPAEWTRANAAWLAGIIDGEGSISVRGFDNAQSRSFVAWMRVGMMDPEVVHRIYEITGVGRVYQDNRGVWNYNVASQACRYVLERIWPWLLIKQRQALGAIELCRHIDERGARGKWAQLTHNDIAYRQTITDCVQAWNRREQTEWQPPMVDKIPLPDYPDGPGPKSLRLLPERYRIAAVDQLGLIARAVIIWDKPNGLPESVTDRVRRSHEDWVHLTKAPRYYAAVDEIREAYAPASLERYAAGGLASAVGDATHPSKANEGRQRRDGCEEDWRGNPLGKLPGSVWRIPSEPLQVPDWVGVDHYAAYPQEWPRRLILGFTPPGHCRECGQARTPVVDKREIRLAERSATSIAGRVAGSAQGQSKQVADQAWMGAVETTITGYRCACPTPNAPTQPAIVLDPFSGTGTTVMVARTLGRYGIGIDLSADYLRLARWRVFSSGHAAKTNQRTWKERQGALL